MLPFFSLDAWGSLYGAGIAPMLKTLRDARRFANVAPAALKLTGGEVAAHDVLALEALRLFDPDVHNALPDLADVLTDSIGIDIRPQQEIEADASSRLEQVLERSAHAETTRELLRLLFPAAGHLLGRSGASSRDWRAQRRVANRSVLDIYLQATLGEEAVTTAQVREALGAIREPARLRQLLEDIPDEQLADLCDRLTDLHSAFSPEHASDAAMVVTLQESRFPGNHGALSGPERWRVSALVDALLHAAPDPATAVQRMIENAPDLSHALLTVNRYGTFTDREDRSTQRELLDEQTTTALVEDMSLRSRSSTPGRLSVARVRSTTPCNAEASWNATSGELSGPSLRQSSTPFINASRSSRTDEYTLARNHATYAARPEHASASATASAGRPCAIRPCASADALL